MPITASQLRADVYNLLDRVLATGEPLEIDRNGRLLRVVVGEPIDWTRRLTRRAITVGDPDALVDQNAASPWTPDIDP